MLKVKQMEDGNNYSNKKKNKNKVKINDPDKTQDFLKSLWGDK